MAWEALLQVHVGSIVEPKLREIVDEIVTDEAYAEQEGIANDVFQSQHEMWLSPDDGHASTHAKEDVGVPTSWHMNRAQQPILCRRLVHAAHGHDDLNHLLTGTTRAVVHVSCVRSRQDAVLLDVAKRHLHCKDFPPIPMPNT